MDMLKKFWPTPFKVKEKDVNSFVVQLIIFVVVCAIAAAVIGILGNLMIVGFVFKILGSLVELYGTIGVVLCILKFCGFLKE